MSDDEIETRLADLPRWSREGDALVCVAAFPSFAAAIGFIAAAGAVAERADHHPDLDLRWRTVTVRLSTHDAGGITALDTEMAEQTNALAR